MPPGKKKTDDGASSDKASDTSTEKKAKSSLKKVAKKLAKKLVKKVTKKAAKKVTKKVSKKAATSKTTAKKTKTTKKAKEEEKTTQDEVKKTSTRKTSSKKSSTRKTAGKKSTTKKASDKKTEETTEEVETPSKKSSSKRGSSRRGSSKKTAAKKDDAKKGSDDANEESSGSEDGGEKKSRRGQGDKSKSGRGGRTGQRRGRRMSIALPEATTGPAPKDRIMLVNEITNEECRIAMIENGRIDEYFVERASSETVVGNIYKARVTNIEPAIQAAFVDFGLGESGFLHVSDLHPKYFPGSDMVEEVGKKIPRRQRPPIQDALKKGQEILVQVLKQGVGTKGPTVTSYLSIPGRLMVMMPDMDRTGVSRKVDEDQRKAMRAILDSLDLPKNFGFIVRTAGLEASKLELKRDVAYLKHVWDQMDRRIQNTGAPCLLYAESDLLIRTIRDVIDQSVKTMVIDNPAAFERATNFLKVAAGSNIPDMRYYDRSVPILNAFGVEKQIDALHDVNVPLKSGGALVIEQTEAMVSIDVNSGRSRSAKDSETNAFETNKEAVDEICRQLRLRDLGGLIVNDLIDMRQASHREEIEKRIMQNLKRDRAKATVLPISEFGLVEMTRQRMRPNTKKANFHLCPTCEGTGEMQRPDTVGRDALRKAATILENELVNRIEMVCSSSIASIIMNDKRAEIAMIEERSGCKISVRVSETIADNRVDIYAYEKDGADVDVAKIKLPKAPNLEDLPLDTEGDEYAQEKGGRKRRRRRRGKTAPADATAIALSGGFEIDEADEDDMQTKTESAETSESKDNDSENNGTGKKRRRRRRGGRGRNRNREEVVEAPAVVEVDPGPIRVHVLAKELEITSREILDRCESEGGFELKNHMSSLQGDGLAKVRGWFTPEPPPAPEKTTSESSEDAVTEGGSADGDGEDKPRKRRRRRRGRRGGRNRSENGDDAPSNEEGQKNSDSEGTSSGLDDHSEAKTSTDDAESSRSDVNSDDPDGQPRKKRRRRRRGGRGRSRNNDENETGDSGSEASSKEPANESSSKSSEERTTGTAPARAERSSRKSGRDQRGGTRKSDEAKPSQTSEAPSKPTSTEAPKPKKPRTLYGGRMRRTTPGG